MKSDGNGRPDAAEMLPSILCDGRVALSVPEDPDSILSESEERESAQAERASLRAAG